MVVKVNLCLHRPGVGRIWSAGCRWLPRLQRTVSSRSSSRTPACPLPHFIQILQPRGFLAAYQPFPPLDKTVSYLRPELLPSHLCPIKLRNAESTEALSSACWMSGWVEGIRASAVIIISSFIQPLSWWTSKTWIFPIQTTRFSPHLYICKMPSPDAVLCISRVIAYIYLNCMTSKAFTLWKRKKECADGRRKEGKNNLIQLQIPEI